MGRSKKNVGEIVEAAAKLNGEYNFFTNNCRHFVLDLLKEIQACPKGEINEEDEGDMDRTT